MIKHNPVFSLIRILCAVTVFAVGLRAKSSDVQIPIITGSGQRVASVFDGVTPNQHVRDRFTTRTTSFGSPKLSPLRDPAITKSLGLSPIANAASCPQGGVCAQPGTTSGVGEFCVDGFGCEVDAHNQVNTEDFRQGTFESYQCSTCCVDWTPCFVDTGVGGGGGGCLPPPPDDDSGPAPDLCDPLVIDLAGNGFNLTDTAGGVEFDIRATGHPFRIPWTTGATAFLVLDRNSNGRIDSGVELFSNLSPQPSVSRPNGFLALAEYDKPGNGGNADGVIDSQDAVFSQLRLWVDANHDGISQPEELHTLPEMGVFSISLDYSLSRRTDQFGNVFRYRAKINKGVKGESDTGKKIYDVFFVTR